MNKSDTSNRSDQSDQVLKRLNWIAAVRHLPVGEAGLRDLLDRIVIDVRSVCTLVESDQSDTSDRSDSKRPPIPPHGGYRTLKHSPVGAIGL